MNSLDLKKLIGSFLLLTVLVSSTAFFFSQKLVQEESPQKISEERQKKDPAPSRAFVEQVGENPAYQKIVEQTPSLTGNFLDAFASELVRVNPNGPSFADAVKGLNIPNANNIISQLASEESLKNIDLPDWEAEVRKQKFTVLYDFSANDLARYNDELNAILEKRFLQNGVAYLDPTNPAAVARFNFGGLPVDQALRDAQKLAVPGSLAGFHRSFVKLLIYKKQAIALAKDAAADPLKTALIVRVQDANYNLAVDNFQDEMARAQKRGLSFKHLKNPPTLTDRIKEFFGVRQAHAFLGIGDIVFDPAFLARTVWEYVQKIALNILKDQLIHRMVKQTIDWLQGGGKPQFITNWKGFLRQTADNVVGDILARTIPQVCESFGPLVKISLLPVEPSADVPVKCTLSQVIGNVKDFAQSFEKGGWIAYGASLESSNNFYGVMIQVGEKVMRERAATKEASAADAESADGQLSSKTCIQWETVYEPLPDGQDGPPKPVKKCLDYSVTTPGSLLAGTISDAMGAPLHRIVNADDLVALINALINAGLTKLIELGKSGITKGLAGVQLKDPKVDQCAGLQGKDLENCQNNWKDPKCSQVNQNVNVNINNVNISGNANVSNASGTSSGGFSGSGSGQGTISAQRATCTDGGPDTGDPGGTGSTRCGVKFQPPNCKCQPNINETSYTTWSIVDQAELDLWASCSPAIGLDCAAPGFGRGTLTGGSSLAGATQYMDALVVKVNAAGGGSITADYRVFPNGEPILQVKVPAGGPIGTPQIEYYDVITSRGEVWMGVKVICSPDNPSW